MTATKANPAGAIFGPAGKRIPRGASVGPPRDRGMNSYLIM
jgi:hypothetical protein